MRFSVEKIFFLWYFVFSKITWNMPDRSDMPDRQYAFYFRFIGLIRLIRLILYYTFYYGNSNPRGYRYHRDPRRYASPRSRRSERNW